MQKILNYLNGEWVESKATEFVEVINPATAELMGRTPLSPKAKVNAAARAAGQAFPEWRRTPPTERVQYLFKLKNLLEEHFEEISCLITMECGKTLEESHGRCAGPSRTSRSPAVYRS